MGRFIDFAVVKAQVPFADAIELLDMRMKFAGNQWRGNCTACGTKDGRSLVITAGEGWFCHAGNVGGDVIALAKHILDLPSMRDAAFELADRAGIRTSTQGTRDTVPSKKYRSVQEPESGRGKKNPRQPRGEAKPSASPHQFDPEEYAAKLDYEHELLTEAGADPERMRECGIGYCSRGVNRGLLVIRVIDEAGEVHFVGVEGSLRLPSTLKTNVVALKRA